MPDRQEDLKERLMAQCQALEIRARNAAGELRKGHSHDSADQAQEREIDDVLGAVERECREEILQIRRAIERIDEGEYGLCRTCGEPIGEQRLLALPYATQCIRCAQQAEV